jgi:hypothetical protein
LLNGVVEPLSDRIVCNQVERFSEEGTHQK